MLNNVKNRISIEDAGVLKNKIEIEEVTRAIEELNNGKSPGSDGLTAEFYKKCKNTLAHIIRNIFNCMIEISTVSLME